MKKTLYAFIFMLSCLNFNLNLAQESDDYESISLTADDHQALASLNTKFIQAVKDNDLAITQQLISQGVDINYQDECGNTAAHYAFSADTDFFSTYNKIRGALLIAQANLKISNLENKTVDDFIGEIRLPFINMSSHEIANSLESMIRLIQPKIEAEANANEEFANFIHNRNFTLVQFDELIKALDENSIAEFMQRHSNES